MGLTLQVDLISGKVNISCSETVESAGAPDSGTSRGNANGGLSFPFRHNNLPASLIA